MRLDLDTATPQVLASEPSASQGVLNNNAETLKELLAEGIKAAQAGSRAKARAALLRVVELEPQSESAWLWLASISEYPEELLVFLHKVLAINPENQRAVEWASATKITAVQNLRAAWRSREAGKIRPRGFLCNRRRRSYRNA